MNRWCPSKARSELVKSRRLAGGRVERRAARGCDLRLAWRAVRRASARRAAARDRRTPRACGSDATSSRLRTACPASRTPALSPTRGSGLPAAARRLLRADDRDTARQQHRRASAPYLQSLHPHLVNSRNIAPMRSISADWSASTSDANPKMSESCAAPGLLHQLLHHRQRALVVRDHAFEEQPIELRPVAPPRGAAICSGVSMPGIITASW